MLDQADRGFVRRAGFGQRRHQRREDALQCGDVEHVLRLTVMAPSTVAGILQRGDAAHPAIVVPDGPTMTYGRLRDLLDEAVIALGAPVSRLVIASRSSSPMGRKRSSRSWPRR